jgi:heat shock protein HtpX
MMLRRSSINKARWFQQNGQNRLQTALLLVFLCGYLFLVGLLVWGSAATVILLLCAGLMFVAVPGASSQLLMKLSGARPLARRQQPELYRLSDELAAAAQLDSPPRLYLLATRQPNALATSDCREPIIAVSAGLLQGLNRRELKAVLAHEVSHLRNGDLQVMHLAAVAARLTGTFSLFGQILLLLNLPLILLYGQSANWLLVFVLIFAPQISSLAQLGLSRVREFNADLDAVRLTGHPEALAGALLKIDRAETGLMRHVLGQQKMVPNWLRTHPSTQERVKRLLSLTEHAIDCSFDFHRRNFDVRC